MKAYSLRAASLRGQGKGGGGMEVRGIGGRGFSLGGGGNGRFLRFYLRAHCEYKIETAWKLA